MKKIIIAFYISLLFQIATAQTYIGATLGLDVIQVKEQPNGQDYFELYGNEGYTFRSMLYGAKLEQQLPSNFLLSLSGTYTQKSSPAIIPGIAAYIKIRYNYYKNSLSLKYQIMDNWRIGIGGTYNFVTKIEQVTKSGYASIRSENQKEYGLLFSAGYQYRSFLLELSHYRGVKTTSSDKFGPLLKPMHSVVLSLNYLFKLPQIKFGKKDKVNCPKL